MSATNIGSKSLEVRVASIHRVAEDVIALELRPITDEALPPFTAGAHIDVELPIRDLNGQPLVRQYSLCNDSAEQDRYVIAIGRDANSRGGSAWLHDHVQAGQSLTISAPRNHFPLRESAAHSVLVAAGIGVTPLLSMARRLSALGRSWTFYYCARTPQRAAFLDELRQLPGTLVPVFDGVPGGQQIDLIAVVAQAPAGAHLYCCGPSGLMGAFEKATSRLPPEQVHVEWFIPRISPAVRQGTDRTFEIRLARTGLRLNVPADKSVLDVLVEAGVSIPHSCCDGVCGTCETRVLEGQPDHRDSVLFGEDTKCTDRMMVCVSRSAGPFLTLDL